MGQDLVTNTQTDKDMRTEVHLVADRVNSAGVTCGEETGRRCPTSETKNIPTLITTLFHSQLLHFNHPIFCISHIRSLYMPTLHCKLNTNKIHDILSQIFCKLCHLISTQLTFLLQRVLYFITDNLVKNVECFNIDLSKRFSFLLLDLIL